MRVLLVNQYFYPDHSATSQIATDLAEDLALAGAKVTVLCGRGSYLGGRQLPSRETYRGIAIVRAPATSLGKRTLLHRAIDYASFYLGAAATLARLPEYDVIVAMTTPPLIGAVAASLKRVKNARLVYWVQDLYPEVAVAFGALAPGSPITRILGAASRFAMRRADRVVALGHAMGRRCTEAGASPEAITIVPNWADADAIRPVDHAHNELRGGIAQTASTVVMYSGNMGRAHDITTLLAAARELRGRNDIAFVFIGDGAKRAQVEAASRELPNIRLAPYQPRDRLSESLSAGDLHLIGLSEDVQGLIEPSKLYGIMAAGRPALFVGPSESEVAQTILQHDCGRVFANGDGERLARTISQLADSPLERHALGDRGRAALEAHYSRRVATDAFRALLSDVCMPSHRA